MLWAAGERFQSAPETGASGGVQKDGLTRRATSFNPLPRPEPREGGEYPDPVTANRFQSAPETGASGGHGVCCRRRLPGSFNPLPRPEPREGCGGRPTRCYTRSFNPLPRPEPREGVPARARTTTAKSFNPLPRPEPREGYTHRPVGDLRRVSIRSRDRSLGRGGHQPHPRLGERFQSAPETGASGGKASRGSRSPTRRFNPLPRPEPREGSPAASSTTRASGFNPLPRPEPREGGLHDPQGQAQHVSIRSRDRSLGRAEYAEGVDAVVEVSIRSRDRSLGRASSRVTRQWTQSFNPLPRPEPREGLLHSRAEQAVAVSIRSRDRSLGRAPPGCGSVPPSGFNPLPRPEPREGTPNTTRHADHTFQSAPETGASGGSLIP